MYLFTQANEFDNQQPCDHRDMVNHYFSDGLVNVTPNMILYFIFFNLSVESTISIRTRMVKKTESDPAFYN